MKVIGRRFVFDSRRFVYARRQSHLHIARIDQLLLLLRLLLWPPLIAFGVPDAVIVFVGRYRSVAGRQTLQRLQIADRRLVIVNGWRVVHFGISDGRPCVVVVFQQRTLLDRGGFGGGGGGWRWRWRWPRCRCMFNGAVPGVQQLLQLLSHIGR